MAASENESRTERPSLLEAAPSDRSYLSLLHHFRVERAIAEQLKSADREGRQRIYASMYDSLFAEVPDHPRLVRRSDSAKTDRANRAKARMLLPFAAADRTLVEVGAGDCRFALAMAGHFGEVYAIDIADQLGNGASLPQNFTLRVYNGYDLDLPADCADVAFSDQLIEHLHPDDTIDHFRLVRRLLKPGGVYLLRTPHRLTGPHDVSRYFSDQAQGFHLKEWTFAELVSLAQRVGFSSVRTFWCGKGRLLRLPLTAFRAVEAFSARAPLRVRRRLLPLLLPSIVIVAEK